METPCWCSSPWLPSLFHPVSPRCRNTIENAERLGRLVPCQPAIRQRCELCLDDSAGLLRVLIHSASAIESLLLPFSPQECISHCEEILYCRFGHARFGR